jgi:hypothetical protein
MAPENLRDEAQKSTTTLHDVPPQGSPRIDEVNVARAEAEFNALSRRLTTRSEHAINDEKSQSSLSTRAGKDAEKGEEEPETFDLREYLTSSNDANQRAGIKHKVGFSSLHPTIVLLLNDNYQ